MLVTLLIRLMNGWMISRTGRIVSFPERPRWAKHSFVVQSTPFFAHAPSSFQVTIIFLCSLASLVLYCIDTKYNTLVPAVAPTKRVLIFTSFRYIESCTRFDQSISMQIDFGLNMIFLLYFLLRVRHWIFSSVDLIFRFTISSLLLRTSDAFGLPWILWWISSPFLTRFSPSISIEIG